MKNLKTKVYKIVGASLLCAVFAASPQFLYGQNKRLYGELTVIKTSSATIGNALVTVDGVRAVNGRSISSPSDITTPPDATARISFAQTGAITLAPNSKINLTFVNSSIAGDLTAGEVTIETVPNTTINIFTKDGAIWTPNRNEKNVVKISIVNGATILNVTSGQVLFNKVLVSAGEFYPRNTNAAAAMDNADSSSNGFRPVYIIAILGAVAAAVAVALSVSSKNDTPDAVPILSPTV